MTAQNHFSLLERRVQAEVVPACEPMDWPVPHFPLASGLLTGKYTRGEARPRGHPPGAHAPERVDRVLSERNFDLVERLTAWAEGQGHTILDLAFAWLAAQPTMGPSSPGRRPPSRCGPTWPRASGQLEPDEVAAVDAILDGDSWRRRSGGCLPVEIRAARGVLRPQHADGGRLRYCTPVEKTLPCAPWVRHPSLRRRAPVTLRTGLRRTAG